MQRYTHANGFLYASQGCGEYVLHSEAQAEIARLQAEVERLKAETYDATKARDLAIEWRDYDKDRLNTAHNDAIEAAASIEVDGYGSLHPMHAYAIRALKRPTQGEQ